MNRKSIFLNFILLASIILSCSNQEKMEYNIDSCIEIANKVEVTCKKGYVYHLDGNYYLNYNIPIDNKLNLKMCHSICSLVTVDSSPEINLENEKYCTIHYDNIEYIFMYDLYSKNDDLNNNCLVTDEIFSNFDLLDLIKTDKAIYTNKIKILCKGENKVTIDDQRTNEQVAICENHSFEFQLCNPDYCQIQFDPSLNIETNHLESKINIHEQLIATCKRGYRIIDSDLIKNLYYECISHEKFSPPLTKNRCEIISEYLLADDGNFYEDVYVEAGKSSDFDCKRGYHKTSDNINYSLEGDFDKEIESYCAENTCSVELISSTIDHTCANQFSVSCQFKCNPNEEFKTKFCEKNGEIYDTFECNESKELTCPVPIPNSEVNWKVTCVEEIDGVWKIQSSCEATSLTGKFMHFPTRNVKHKVHVFTCISNTESDGDGVIVRDFVCPLPISDIDKKKVKTKPNIRSNWMVNRMVKVIGKENILVNGKKYIFFYCSDNLHSKKYSSIVATQVTCNAPDTSKAQDAILEDESCICGTEICKECIYNAAPKTRFVKTTSAGVKEYVYSITVNCAENGIADVSEIISEPDRCRSTEIIGDENYFKNAYPREITAQGHFELKEGYELTFLQQIRTNLLSTVCINGQPYPANATVSETVCNLGFVRNGLIKPTPKCSQLWIVNNCKILCSPGYEIEGKKSKKLKCNIGGQATLYPKCVAIVCDKPAAKDNGSFSEEGGSITIETNYVCDENYSFVNSNGDVVTEGIVSCEITNEGNKVATDVPECSINKCTVPEIENGSYTNGCIPGEKKSAKCHLTCDNLYELKINNWQNTKSKFTEISCKNINGFLKFEPIATCVYVGLPVWIYVCSGIAISALIGAIFGICYCKKWCCFQKTENDMFNLFDDGIDGTITGGTVLFV